MARADRLLKFCPTKVEFLEKFNFDNCINRYAGINTPELALLSNKLKLREISKIYSKDTPSLLIEAWLIMFADFMGMEITDQMIKETAQYIYEDNSFWNLAEATLFFKKLKKGHYGNFFGKFDGMRICMAAREYRMQRGIILSKLTEEQQLKIINT